MLTKVTPALIQVANNVTSTTLGNSTTSISLTFDESGVIVAASNTPLEVNTAQIVDGAITPSKLSANTIPQIVKPSITSPANNATGILDTQLITATSFLSLYGYSQANAEWQLSTSSDFSYINVSNTIAGSNSEFQLNASSGLAESQTYYARVRYSDTATPNNTSQYSDTVNFTTASAFPFLVYYVVVAGGGSGGYRFGGGGAGGYRSSVPGESSGGGASAENALSLVVSTNYPVTIGGGGNAAPSNNPNGVGDNGNPSTFHTVTSVGGGAGGSDNVSGTFGVPGGSGGGGSGDGAAAGASPGGSGTANQGFAGGEGWRASAANGGGGGGGAGSAGTSAGGTNGAGAAGNGVESNITGSPVKYAGGGGSSGQSGTIGTVEPGAGGGVAPGNPGTTNRGGGGGSGKDNVGGNGGSGVVILRYPNARTLSNPGGGLTIPSPSPVGSNTVTTITAGTGNISWS